MGHPTKHTVIVDLEVYMMVLWCPYSWSAKVTAKTACGVFLPFSLWNQDHFIDTRPKLDLWVVCNICTEVWGALRLNFNGALWASSYLTFVTCTTDGACRDNSFHVDKFCHVETSKLCYVEEICHVMLALHCQFMLFCRKI